MIICPLEVEGCRTYYEEVLCRNRIDVANSKRNANVKGGTVYLCYLIAENIKKAVVLILE